MSKSLLSSAGRLGRRENGTVLTASLVKILSDIKASKVFGHRAVRVTPPVPALLDTHAEVLWDSQTEGQARLCTEDGL